MQGSVTQEFQGSVQEKSVLGLLQQPPPNSHHSAEGPAWLDTKPIRLAHIKPSFLRNRHSGVKVGSALEFLHQPFILFDLGKKGCELPLLTLFYTSATAILPHLPSSFSTPSAVPRPATSIATTPIQDLEALPQSFFPTPR